MTEPDPPWLRLAHQALRLTIRGEHDAAARTVEQLAAIYGGQTLPDVMCTWADAVLAHYPPNQPGEAVTLAFLNAETGVISSSDDVHPSSAWAGQLIAARAADDEATFCGLIDAAASGEEYSQRVGVMLLTCAVNVRDARRRGLKPVHLWPIATGGQTCG